MHMRIGMASVVVGAVSLALAASAAAATPAQYGAKCNAAWTGKRGTHDYRLYKKSCLTAAISAAQAAQTAGDSDDDAANNSRAVTACREQFPPPRRTKTARAAYRACVSAAVSAQKAYGGRPLGATLAGVIGDGTTDQDGTGGATFTLNQGHGQICYDVNWSGLAVVSGLHIHAAADNTIVVPLDADTNLTDSNAKGCVSGIAKNVIQAIRQHPNQYYVNLHTDEFPTGAIRGTLHN
jgi:CHRD domain